MWGKQFFTYRNIIILGLFLIACLHAIAFGFVQYPSNFLTSSVSQFYHKFLLYLLYGSVIITGLFNQSLTRTFGLKRSLIIGLYLYFFGIIFFHAPHFMSDFSMIYASLILGMVFLGVAFSVVFVGLATYLIVEIPFHVGIGITVLFAFMNLGAMLSTIFLTLFADWQSGSIFALTMEVLILFSIIFIHFALLDPPFPKHLAYLRKGTRIWKEMHYRLALFIIAIIFYGLSENTFNLWGEKLLGFFLEPDVVHGTISIFWLFMIIGQILTLIPLYFISARNVLYFLGFLMILALFTFPFQTKLPGFIAMLTLGGIACAAIFPILLSMLEEEIKEIKSELDYHLKVLPYLEMGIAWMMMGYIFGTGLITIEVESATKSTFESVSSKFFIAMIYAIIMLIIAYFLSTSFQQKMKSKNKWFKGFF